MNGQLTRPFGNVPLQDNGPQLTYESRLAGKAGGGSGLCSGMVCPAEEVKSSSEGAQELKAVCDVDRLGLVAMTHGRTFVRDPDLTARFAYRSFWRCIHSHPRGTPSRKGRARNEKRKAKLPFDPKVFLAKVNGGT